MKTVACYLCGETVSKRSTLLVNGNRMCRKHQEVKQHLQEVADKEAQEKADAEAMEKARENLEIITRESLVKSLRDVRAIDPSRYEFAIQNLAFNKGAEYASKIQTEVESVEVDADDAVDSIVSGMLFLSRFKD